MSSGKNANNANDEKQFGKFTFWLFRNDKRISLSLELIIVQYFEALFTLSNGKLFGSKRDAILDLSEQIQIFVDQYDGCDYRNVSLLNYVKHQILEMILESEHVSGLHDIVHHVRIKA